ncbi:MAG: alkaline phosphatase D family protein [Burkholderiaceae bacterium]|nr:alkaline phosphatase D family protein [Burkholderiaceae bacterium]
MKVAFTSCMSTTVFAQQPVWDQIAAQNPDRLLLLGDSIYIDAMPYPNQATHPKQLELTDFQHHVLARWRLQLDQPQFRALVQKVPTDAVWDDHDFLWDEASTEGAIGRKIYDGNIRISRALFNAFCRTLEARLAPGSFPAAYNDASINQPNEPPPGYRFRSLADDLKLHLTDGRSWRIGKELLGAAQRKQIEANLAASPKAVHLLASGSVVEDDSGERWNQFDDYAWLKAQARQFDILVLSGDIHANRFKSTDLGQGRWLHDATASGAAIKKLVGAGSKCENYGLLTTAPTQLRLDFFSHGTPDSVGAWAIDRASWKATSV